MPPVILRPAANDRKSRSTVKGFSGPVRAVYLKVNPVDAIMLQRLKAIGQQRPPDAPAAMGRGHGDIDDIGFTGSGLQHYETKKRVVRSDGAKGAERRLCHKRRRSAEGADLFAPVRSDHGDLNGHDR